MERRCKSISSSFPMDLTSEILLRLPVKSLVRFRCVSKLWLSNTTDPYFINLFETRKPRPSVLLCFIEDDELVVTSIPQHTLSLDQNSRISYSQPTHTYRMKFPGCSGYFSPTASVHGLICFRTFTTVIVWNPSTRKSLTLPRPSKNWSNIIAFLGYDAVEAKHKVIVLHSRSAGKVCRVITLGSAQEESWRVVRTNQNHSPYHLNGFGQCINGVIYYLASTYQTHVLVIMRFDVRSEKFDVIQLPSDIQVERLITYDGRLACLHKQGSTEKNGITLSILDEDAVEEKWLSKDLLVPFTLLDQSSRTTLIGFTHSGEFIYHPYLHRKSWYVSLFDPERKSFRRFGFRGMADDGKYRYPNYFFPNHIESQLSL